jgi:VanZ family protein
MRFSFVGRWLPALLVMGIIFWFSSQPSGQLPDFNWADRLIKKSGHVAGYASLAVSYWHAFGMHGKHRWLAWLCALAYAVTDEYHQSFVPGRNPSIWDVVVFDNLGALLGLWLVHGFVKQKRPAMPTADH